VKQLLNSHCTQCGFNPCSSELEYPEQYEEPGNYRCPYCDIGIIKVYYEEPKMKLCAIDTETTNIDSSKARVVEITILPLTEQFEPDTSIVPLSTLVNPGKHQLDLGKEALAFNKIPRSKILKEGIKSKDLTEYIRKWMEDNSISTIEPLAHNWAYDRTVLRNTLEFNAIERLFYRRAKDSHTSAVFINDVYKMLGKKKPFAKTNLSAMAEYFGMSSKDAHTATGDCLMTAFVYKNLLKMVSVNELDIVKNLV
jgi:DNA polymerase III epsilon subunit-like protein